MILEPTLNCNVIILTKYLTLNAASSQTSDSTVSVHISLELELKDLKETRNSQELSIHRKGTAHQNARFSKQFLPVFDSL